MQTRESDYGDLALPKVSVNRVLPLWSILTFIGLIVGQAVVNHFALRDLQREQVTLGSQQEETSKDVKSIKQDLEKTNRETYALGFQHGDLNRRLMIIEEWRKGKQ